MYSGFAMRVYNWDFTNAPGKLTLRRVQSEVGHTARDPFVYDPGIPSQFLSIQIRDEAAMR
jgi:hypothetical protein